MTTLGQAQNSSKIETFLIYPHEGGSKEMRQSIVLADYYESILENHIQITLVLADIEGSFQELKLVGSEKVEIIFEDNFENKLKFDELYISKIRNVFSHTSNTIFTLDLVPKEAFINENTLIYDGYTGRLSESIRKILISKLKTSKRIDIDETENAPNFNGDGKKPFRLCTEMSKKCIPTGEKKSAGYFFFETYDGYNVKSIDKLFDTSRKYRSYIYNLTTGLPKGYDGKILEYHANKTIDVKQRLMMGTYGSKLQTFDPYADKFDSTRTLTNDEQKVLGGKETPKLNSAFSPESRVFYKKLDVGVMPNGKTAEDQLKGQTQENYKASDLIMQSPMRYNQIFTLMVTITIAGDSSHRAGDLIYCDFPEQSGGSPQIDKEISGLYLISDICYHITPQATYTKMNLIRDSYGRTATSPSL
jgi:hypothetical protein